MDKRLVRENIYLLGSIDWNRTLFDSLMPLPHGTSYNAYLIRGSEKTVLIDTDDPDRMEELFGQLADVPKLDAIISLHTEQDHSGALPSLLEKYPDAVLFSSQKAQTLLSVHLGIPESRITPVKDGDTYSLGDRTLTFVDTPWVHWPETMSVYLKEDKVLFSCDLFGSHLATSAVFADEKEVYAGAKSYFAEIMMPFRKYVQKHLEKLAAFDIAMICPSHGPVYDNPAFIMEAYREWAGDTPKNLALIPYVSMHHSTKLMAEHLAPALVARGVEVSLLDLATVDLDRIGTGLVDAATILLGTPTVLGGPHPFAQNAAFLVSILKPRAKFASVFGSYGWASKTVEAVAGMLDKYEILPAVYVKGLPTAEAYAGLDALADAVAAKHREIGIL